VQHNTLLAGGVKRFPPRRTTGLDNPPDGGPFLSPMPRTREPQTLAEAIKAEREKRGWSQSKLARKLDTGEKNVKNWEAGKRPSFPLYARMCLLFEWPLPYSGDRPIPGKRYLANQGMPVVLSDGQAVAVR
jgi:DNA-binding XRE family transcriptional regulator